MGAAFDSVRTMVAKLYGQFEVHSRRDGLGEPPEDAYSLFYSRSRALGWLKEATTGDPGGAWDMALWGMNEGEAIHGAGLVGFFQVVLLNPATERLLPTEPFLACVDDVMARLGLLSLGAVDLSLPPRGTPPPGELAALQDWERRVSGPLRGAANWFGNCDPQLRVPVRVTLDGGADVSIQRAAEAILYWAGVIRVQTARDGPNVFVANSVSLAETDHLEAQIANPDASDSERHRITFQGTLAEWSLPALGWLAAFLSDGATRHGVRSALSFSARRED